jgi:hypothetical protein
MNLIVCTGITGKGAGQVVGFLQGMQDSACLQTRAIVQESVW